MMAKKPDLFNEISMLRQRVTPPKKYPERKAGQGGKNWGIQLPLKPKNKSKSGHQKCCGFGNEMLQSC